ncbi:hypothetical protein [Streptomyces sp. WZ-12]|uniref:hypothetical protein n=1 Tax=Streptomyces sp. WZ-12 TaxID=3030210 RepID=UPI0023811C0E|nr:hypothetical protein [Streptomyces sp. WZ-12]
MKAMRYLAALGVAGAALGAGAVSVAAPVGPGAASATHGVVLTGRDNGRTLTVRSGDAVEVRLTGERGSDTTFAWSVPASSTSAVLRRTAAGTTPTGGAAARFVATGQGTAALTARRTCHAAPGHVCPHVVLPWRSTVRVG